MRLKSSKVILNDLPTLLTLCLVDLELRCWHLWGLEMVITSAAEQTTRHKLYSTHYRADGVDLRSHNLNRDQKQSVMRRVKDGWGPDIQIYLEDEGESNEHFHIHYRPARRSP